MLVIRNKLDMCFYNKLFINVHNKIIGKEKVSITIRHSVGKVYIQVYISIIHNTRLHVSKNILSLLE